MGWNMIAQQLILNIIFVSIAVFDSHATIIRTYFIAVVCDRLNELFSKMTLNTSGLSENSKRRAEIRSNINFENFVALFILKRQFSFPTNNRNVVSTEMNQLEIEMINIWR